MPELALPDVALHYEIDGQGPPLLMLAGFMSDSASWAPLVPLLSPHFTLIRPDNRTTGRTTPWNAPASPTIWAQDALALLDHLGHPQTHVIGHSLGGNIGWALAQSAPSRIASYTMAASAPIGLTRNMDLFRTLIAIRRSDAPTDTWLRALFPWLFSTAVYDVPGAVDAAVAQSLAYPHAQSPDAMDHQLAAILAADPAIFRETPNVPTQALLAENDLLVPLDLAQSALEGVAQNIITGAGHSIHWDAPNAVADHLHAFTSQHPIG